MGKLKKIKPKLNYSYYHYSINDNILSPGESYIQKHDNGKFKVAGSGARGECYIRVPSIKRSAKVWRNFYMLFPHIYKRMRKCAEEQNAKPGSIINMYWASTFGFWDRHRRNVKVLVLDLTGEFLKISDPKILRWCGWNGVNEKYINEQTTCKV